MSEGLKIQASNLLTLIEDIRDRKTTDIHEYLAAFGKIINSVLDVEDSGFARDYRRLIIREIANVLQERTRDPVRYVGALGRIYKLSKDFYRTLDLAGVLEDSPNEQSQTSVSSGMRLDLRLLPNLIEQGFNNEEFRALCHDLGVNYDNLAGETLALKSRELVVHMQRRNKLLELMRELQQQRDDRRWEAVVKE